MVLRRMREDDPEVKRRRAMTKVYIQKIHQMEPEAAQAATQDHIKAHADLLACRILDENKRYTFDTLPYPIKLNDEVIFHLG